MDDATEDALKGILNLLREMNTGQAKSSKTTLELLGQFSKDHHGIAINILDMLGDIHKRLDVLERRFDMKLVKGDKT